MTDPTPTERIDEFEKALEYGSSAAMTLPSLMKEMDEDDTLAFTMAATLLSGEYATQFVRYARLGAMVDPQLLYQALFMGNRAGRAHLEAVVAAAERIKVDE
jgi:hypothetical protein